MLWRHLRINNIPAAKIVSCAALIKEEEPKHMAIRNKISMSAQTVGSLSLGSAASKFTSATNILIYPGLFTYVRSKGALKLSLRRATFPCM